MSTLRNAVARTVNRVLRKANLAIVRRDRHEALARGQQRPGGAEAPGWPALGRDARPLHERVRTLDAEALGLLAGRALSGAALAGGTLAAHLPADGSLPGTQSLGHDVLVVGAGRAATLLADAVRTTGRTAHLVDASDLDAALVQTPEADVVVVEPAASAEAYELVHRLRFEQGRRAFTADQLVGGAALLEVTDHLTGFSVQPLAKALGQIAGAPISEPIARLNEREPLTGKRAIELGPVDGCMTGGLVAAGAASVMCVEDQLGNVLKVLVARQLMGWPHVDLVIDDLHHVDGNAYGTFDVAVAHGVYHQSAAPFRLLENLTTLADTIFLGGYCADPDRPRAPLVTLQWGGQTVRAQPIREPGVGDGARTSTDGDVSGYAFVPADLIGLFEAWGFDVEIIDLETMPLEHTASQYLRIIARRRA